MATYDPDQRADQRSTFASSAAYKLGRLRRSAAPITSRLTPLRGGVFRSWPGEEHEYFVHPYNETWRNERAVEVPLAFDFLRRHGTGRGAEIGNVLSHYGCPVERDIVDAYDTAPGVINRDVIDYQPAEPLDFIVSISTLEHVGWDERPHNPEKMTEAFLHLRSLLSPTGRMFLTVPFGYNPYADTTVLDGRWPVERQITLVREGGRWGRTDDLEFRSYCHAANSVWIAEVARAQPTP